MPSSFPVSDVDAFTSWTRVTSITTRVALFLCFVAVLLAGGAVMARVDAATLIVTNTNDNGPGSLRQALADAIDGDTIQFVSALNGQTIYLTNGQLVINNSITVSGPGPALLTVARAQQAALGRIFSIPPGLTVGISGLTISSGRLTDENGGGISNDHATLTITDCVISMNQISLGFSQPTGGGGIYNSGTLSLVRSTV